MSLIACSKKQGSTSSKIKLFSSNAFAAGGALETKANNGLVLYGFNNNGKSFLQKVDSDTVDLVFPNGTWNFFAVSWEKTSPTSAFQGKVYCAKALGVNLNGTDASINLLLSNSNCLDANFASSSSVVSSVVELPSRQFITCRDLSTVSGHGSTCNRTPDLSTSNRGYATFFKLLLPQYKNSGNGFEPIGTPIVSGCMEINSTTMVGESVLGSVQAAGTIVSSSLRLPDAGNGLGYMIRAYYSKTACDDSTGFEDILLPSNPTPRTKSFYPVAAAESVSSGRVFFQANENQICQPPRLDTSNGFAGGRGTSSAPYVICNPAQFNQIDTRYFDATDPSNNKSFELAANLNFNFGAFNSVGSSTPGDLLTSASQFTGTLFEGNGHRMENIIIKSMSGAGEMGIFRSVGSTNFQNLIINQISIETAASAYVGGLAGMVTNANLSNVLLFGHIEASHMVGGMVGYVSGTININGAHGNIDVLGGGSGTAGGIVGIAFLGGNSTITNSSFKGRVKSANDSVGAMVGYASVPTASTLTISNSSSRMHGEAADSVGGIIGTGAGTGTVDISNVYAIGSLRSTNDLNVGGIIGKAINANILNSYALIQKLATAGSGTYGGIYGSTTGTITCSGGNFYFNDNASTITAGCNASTNKLNTQVLLQNAAQVAFAANPNWIAVNAGDLPRLSNETAIAQRVPYLGVTACDGNNSAMAGSGTLIAPFLVCNPGQFTSIAAGNVYKLKQDLFFNSDITTFSAGNYFISGNGHTLFGLTVPLSATPTEHEGLFKSLGASSIIKDLNFMGSKAYVASQLDTTGANYAYGFLTGSNAGLITNIKIEQSKFSLAGITGSGNMAFGGFVGSNSGTIKSINMSIDLNSTLGIDATGVLLWGGVAASNSGTISIVRDNGSMLIDHANLVYSGTHKYAKIAAENSGTGLISEISENGSIQINGSSGSITSGKMAPVVVTNTGSIKDVLYRTTISNTNTSTSGIVFSNVSGSIDRLILAPGSMIGFAVSFPVAGTVTESFCLFSSTDNCFGTVSYNLSSGLFSISGSPFGGSTSYGSLPSSSNGWNMASLNYPDLNYTWSYGGGGVYPSLMKTDGNFKEIGDGF